VTIFTTVHATLSVGTDATYYTLDAAGLLLSSLFSGKQKQPKPFDIGMLLIDVSSVFNLYSSLSCRPADVHSDTAFHQTISVKTQSTILLLPT